MSFVRWEKSRKWTLRIYGPFKEGPPYGNRYHSTITVVASRPEDAMEFVSQKYPQHRLETCVDGGQIDYIVDLQGVEQ